MDDMTTISEHQTLIALKSNIQKNVKDIIGINVGVTFREPGSIERVEGKTQRVVDKRKEQEGS
jgi:phenylacetate-CoA ligase